MKIVLTSGLLAGMALGAAGGIRVDCYRNVFSRDPNEVEALATARVKPDWTGELPTTCFTSPWHPKICDRLMGSVARGWLVPKVTGEYTFIHIVDSSEMKFMLSSNADAKNLKEVKLVPGKGFGDVHVEQKSKTESVRVVDKAAYNPKPIRLEKGKRYAFRLYAIAGRACEPPRFEWACAYNSADKEADIDDVSLDAIGEEDESLGPAVNRKVTAVREPIPASGLAAEKEGEWAAPREFAATPVGTGGEEPDGLSRENLAINLTAMREYLAFARAGKAQVAAGSPRKVPYARLPLSGNKLAFAVKASGDYRLWIRYRHRKGYNCYMDTTIFRKDDPYTPVHHQLFGRGITKYGSCTTDYPTPQLMHIPEGTETGFRWECSSRMLHLEPGEYVATIDHGWGVPLNCDIDFKGLVLDGDPMREPGEKDVIKKPEYGTHELSDDARAHAALLGDTALFERWRTAFLKKLEQ